MKKKIRMESDREEFYRTLCSSETLRSGSKGFFRDFSESVIETAGETWIREIFGRINSDVDRIKLVLTDPRVKDVVTETLGRIKNLYRDKDAVVSRNKRLEGLENSAQGNHEKALLLFSQAVLRAPATGKFPAVDQGYSLPLGLLARGETLMDLGDYHFALADLELASEENLPQNARIRLTQKIEECKRLSEATRKSLTVSRAHLPEIDQLKKQFRASSTPSVKDGPSSREDLSGASKLVDIAETSIAGKHAVAAGEIFPGDVLASEPPLASCLLPEFYGTHCQHCLIRLRAPLGCPVCSSVAFCGRKCRDQALSSYHKYECKILALLIGSGMSVLSTLALRMVTQEGYENSRRICEKLKNQKFLSTETNARVVREKENDGEQEGNVGEDGSLSKSAKRRLRKKKLKENTLHREGFNETTKEEEKVDMRAYDLVTLAGRRSAKDFFERTLMALFLLKGLQKVRFFNNIDKCNDTTSEEEIQVGALLLRNLQLLQFNAHEIYETRLAPNHRYRGNKTVYVGVAIYPSVARFNHECYPAVTRYFIGRNIVIRALRPLKPGDVIAENYGPIFTKKNLKERQRSLMGRYWFRCSCIACVERWPGFEDLTNEMARLRCPTSGCKGLLVIPRRPEHAFKCSSCQKTKNLEERLRSLAECENDYKRGFDRMEKEKTQEAINILAMALEKFHRIASPPHRETHLAEIAIAACMADSGNTWRPVQ